MLTVMVTSGGTISRIDDVRHIGNFSEGTTGARIAEEFLRCGATVHYVHAKRARRPFRDGLIVDPTLPRPEELSRVGKAYDDYQRLANHLHEHPYETFDEYLDTVRTVLSHQPIDVAILAAAVSDYGTEPHRGKLSSDAERLRIDLVRLPKVISLVKIWKPDVFQVGFKLLADATEDVLIETAFRHGQKNGSDLTVGNAVVGGDFRNRVTAIVTPERQVTPVSVADLPATLADAVLQRMRDR